MTYHPAYYSCDVCQRALSTGLFSELHEGDLHHDGKGKHICTDCSVKRATEPLTVRAGLDYLKRPAAEEER